MSLMAMDDRNLKGAPMDVVLTPVSVESLRAQFLDECCIRELEMPTSLDADLRETRGGPVDEEHLLDFYGEINKQYHVHIPVARWSEAENQGLPMPKGVSTYFSLNHLATEVNSQLAGNRPASHLPPYPKPRPKG